MSTIINQSLKLAIIFRFSSVGLNMVYYALVTKVYSAELASSLFLYITLITAGEMLICGALEPQVMQNRYGSDDRKKFNARGFVAIVFVVIGFAYKVEFLALLAMVSNSRVRETNALARKANKGWAVFFDGQLQALLNLILAGVSVLFDESLVVFIPLATSILILPAIKIVARLSKLTFNLAEVSCSQAKTDLAVYLQFINYSFQSLMLAAITGKEYRDIFLAHRFGDSVMNFSRIFQWVNVEKIQAGSSAYNFTSKHLFILFLMVFAVISGGSLYGQVAEVTTSYFLYLPAFSTVAVLAVLQANLTQVMVRDGSSDVLLKIRASQLLVSFFGGGVGYYFSSILPVVIFTGLSHALAWKFNYEKKLSSVC